MTTKKQQLCLAYFLGKSTFFGIGYSRLFNISKNDTWISIILGTLFGIIIVYLISKIMDHKKGLTLVEYLKAHTVINIFTKISMIFLCCYIFIEEIMILSNFMTSFFLLNTPTIIISLPIVILILYVLKKGLNSILKTNIILFYISILVTIITFFALSIYPQLDYLKPILINKYSNIVKSALLYTIYSTIPLILLVNLNSDGKGLIKIYLLSSLRILLLGIFILTIFGPQLTMVYRFPEYIVLKRIKILSFIEKIESILSIIYIFDSYTLLLLSAYTIKKLLGNNQISKISFPILIITITIGGTIFLGNNYKLSLGNYYLSPYIYSIGYLIIIILIIKTIKKKPKLQIQRDT